MGVTAFDEDEEGSPNSLLSYRLLSPTDDFEIDPKSGNIRLLRELDRERQDKYELLIVAEDQGTPKLSSIAIIKIEVEDRNDCAPKFREPFASRIVTIMEDWPVGGVVLQILASDEDSGLGGKVRYSLISKEEDFSLDEVSGVLRIRKELDYETTSIYNLTVRATDLGNPPLHSETFIVIEVRKIICFLLLSPFK